MHKFKKEKTSKSEIHWFKNKNSKSYKKIKNDKFPIIFKILLWHTPNSLKDSNVNPSKTQQKKEELGHAP